MAKVFECELDGAVLRGEDDDDLVANVWRHVADAHPELVGTVAREDILASAREEGPAFADFRVHAALPALDLERARRFYAEKLGLTPTAETEKGLTYACGAGSGFFLYPSAIPSRGGHTQIGIEVPSLDAAMAELRSRGVAFEDYDTGELRTVDGIVGARGGPRGAWFKDSEGNLVGVVQF
jgi:catechol 2,3-dioxygenase-like lactoylglutathione lyase family enzyme